MQETWIKHSDYTNAHVHTDSRTRVRACLRAYTQHVRGEFVGKKRFNQSEKGSERVIGRYGQSTFYTFMCVYMQL